MVGFWGKIDRQKVFVLLLTETKNKQNQTRKKKRKSRNVKVKEPPTMYRRDINFNEFISSLFTTMK